MKRKRLSEVGCPLTRSLEVVGDRWTLLILKEAFAGTRRFEEFRARLDIARNILSGRLKALVSEAVLERKLYQSHPDRYEYRLSEKGMDLYAALMSLRGWGQRWLLGDTRPARDLVHEGCGDQFIPVLTCSACGDAVGPGDLGRVLLPGREEPRRAASAAS